MKRVLFAALALLSVPTVAQAPQGLIIQGVGTVGQTKQYNIVRLNFKGHTIASASYIDLNRISDAFLVSSFDIHTSTLPSNLNIHIAKITGHCYFRSKYCSFVYTLVDDDTKGDTVGLIIKYRTTTLVSFEGPSNQGKAGCIISFAS